MIDIQNENMMSFEGCTVSEFLKREKEGIIEGCANPFNGILYSKTLIDTIGYPKKEMFIWGDEINYDLLAKKAGFQPIMVENAIHRHPLNRQNYVKYLGNHWMTVPDKDWKLFCYLRNRTYNTKIFSRRIACLCQAMSDLFKFGCYFLIQVHQPAKLSIVISSIIKGVKEDFSGLEKYLK